MSFSNGSALARLRITVQLSLLLPFFSKSPNFLIEMKEEKVFYVVFGVILSINESQVGADNNYLLLTCLYNLKEPKLEIFDFWVFAQIRPIWIGHLGTRPKNYKF
jgi:hypothetical protein